MKPNRHPAVVAAVAAVLVLCGSAAAAASGAVAKDEAYVARQHDNCAAFTSTPHHCTFAAATTSNQAGGQLHAIELVRQSGDDCLRGIVYFFDGTRFITSTRHLPPRSAGGVKSVRSPGPGRFAVVYWVNKSDDTTCAEGGDAGTDTYVYRWTGSHMVKQSGQLPPSPKVILGKNG